MMPTFTESNCPGASASAQACVLVARDVVQDLLHVLASRALERVGVEALLVELPRRIDTVVVVPGEIGSVVVDRDRDPDHDARVACDVLDPAVVVHME